MKVVKEKDYCLKEYKTMKKLIVLIVIAVVIASCGNDQESGKVKLENNEKVVTTFANGSPQIVRQFEKNDDTLVAVYEKEYYDDGNLLKEGPILNNKRNGKWKTYYRTGKIWNEGKYKEGVRDDTIKGYYVNGNLKYKGIFKDGEKTGVWLYFDENGKFKENQVYMKPGEKREDTLYMPQ